MRPTAIGVCDLFRGSRTQKAPVKPATPLGDVVGCCWVYRLDVFDGVRLDQLPSCSGAVCSVAAINAAGWTLACLQDKKSGISHSQRLFKTLGLTGCASEAFFRVWENFKPFTNDKQAPVVWASNMDRQKEIFELGLPIGFALCK